MDFKIGDKVKIKTDKVLEEYKKYNKVYTIIDAKEIKDYTYIYKLGGVPNWGTSELLELVEEESN